MSTSPMKDCYMPVTLNSRKSMAKKASIPQNGQNYVFKHPDPTF